LDWRRGRRLAEAVNVCGKVEQLDHAAAANFDRRKDRATLRLTVRQGAPVKADTRPSLSQGDGCSARELADQ
jgi:hypothetical protein